MIITTETIETINEAYGASTAKCNRFAPALEALGAEAFYADGEHCWCFDNAILSTPSLDPMSCEWAPTVTFMDGSGTIELGWL